MGCVFERGHGVPRTVVVISDVLDDNDWDVISDVAQSGEAALYWDVGDGKRVHLEGTCGTLSLNLDLGFHIIGINHQDVNGITFQLTTALRDSKYNSTNRTGGKYFNINHWGASSSPYSTNYGGWSGCDLRYDVLGSTDTPPSGYGSTPTSSRVGYDASSTTATNPVSNTFMSCLPSDLRAVMQPMTVYTNNTGYSSSSAAVTSSIDYLPLAAEYEVFGSRTYANTSERNNQEKYAYFTDSDSRVKINGITSSAVTAWWLRSPYYNNRLSFCYVSTSGSASSHAESRTSFGLSPMFRV